MGLFLKVAYKEKTELFLLAILTSNMVIVTSLIITQINSLATLREPLRCVFKPLLLLHLVLIVLCLVCSYSLYLESDSDG